MGPFRIYLFSFIGVMAFYFLKKMEQQFHKAYDQAHKDRLDTINATHKNFAKIQAMHIYQMERTQALADAITFKPHDKSLHGHAWSYRIYGLILVVSTAIVCVDLFMFFTQLM